MLDRCQYEILNNIRKRTDGISLKFRPFISVKEDYDIWRFIQKNNFIEGKIPDFTVITFSGRVALAAYEVQHESP